MLGVIKKVIMLSVIMHSAIMQSANMLIAIMLSVTMTSGILGPNHTLSVCFDLNKVNTAIAVVEHLSILFKRRLIMTILRHFK